MRIGPMTSVAAQSSQQCMVICCSSYATCLSKAQHTSPNLGKHINPPQPGSNRRSLQKNALGLRQPEEFKRDSFLPSSVKWQQLESFKSALWNIQSSPESTQVQPQVIPLIKASEEFISWLFKSSLSPPGRTQKLAFQCINFKNEG